jgi:hypothetical protein
MVCFAKYLRGTCILAPCFLFGNQSGVLGKVRWSKDKGDQGANVICCGGLVEVGWGVTAADADVGQWTASVVKHIGPFAEQASILNPDYCLVGGAGGACFRNRFWFWFPDSFPEMTQAGCQGVRKRYSRSDLLVMG